MRCNQVSILIERFGKYVPKDYPADVQRISVYVDDGASIYAALSKAYAMAVNELNESEPIGARTDVSTNEFAHIDYREMHGVIPKLKRSYSQDFNLEYSGTRLPLLKDKVWVYEHSSEIMDVIKNNPKNQVADALKECFGLDDVQIRKLSQMRMDMMDRDEYEKTKEEIEKIENRKNEQRLSGGMESVWQRKIYQAEREITEINAMIVAAEHYVDIVGLMKDSESEKEFMDTMKEKYGFTYEQSRNVRFAPANDYSKSGLEEYNKRLERLKDDIEMYQRFINEEKEAMEKKDAEE